MERLSSSLFFVGDWLVTVNWGTPLYACIMTKLLFRQSAYSINEEKIFVWAKVNEPCHSVLRSTKSIIM